MTETSGYEQPPLVETDEIPDYDLQTCDPFAGVVRNGTPGDPPDNPLT